MTMKIHRKIYTVNYKIKFKNALTDGKHKYYVKCTRKNLNTCVLQSL